MITSKRKLQNKNLQHLPKEAPGLLKSSIVEALSRDDQDDDDSQDGSRDDGDDLCSHSEDEFYL